MHVHILSHYPAIVDIISHLLEGDNKHSCMMYLNDIQAVTKQNRAGADNIELVRMVC